MSADAALLEEISRLTGAINQHKSSQQNPPSTRGYPPRGRYAHRGAYRGSYRPPYTAPRPPPEQLKEVEIGGVTYMTDGKKMTRKDVMDRPAPIAPSAASTSGTRSSSASGSDYIALNTNGGFRKPGAPADLAAKRTRLNNLTLILNNAQAQRTRRRQPLSAKSSAEKKQCRFFTRTGICTRGRTCPYQHDPDKVAMCPQFLKGDCPNGDNCPLSHEPTPQRMPFCVHFANAGRCKNGDSCIYPHVHLGANAGVCRDFAVLGYCEKGADCDKKHVRECPDFADTGVCKNRHCKLPHVIRAKHAAKQVTLDDTTASIAVTTVSGGKPVSHGKRKADTDDTLDHVHGAKKLKVEAGVATFADEPEFIPLTFEESEEEEEEEQNEDGQDVDQLDEQEGAEDDDDAEENEEDVEETEGNDDDDDDDNNDFVVTL